MLNNNAIGKGTVKDFTRHELLELHPRQQLLKHLFHNFLLVPVLVDNISQHTSLLLRNGLDVLLIAAEPLDVAVVVVGVFEGGLFCVRLGFCGEEFARGKADALCGDFAFSGLEKVVFQVYFLARQALC
jgi:hypothetical protein